MWHISKTNALFLKAGQSDGEGRPVLSNHVWTYGDYVVSSSGYIANLVSKDLTGIPDDIESGAILSIVNIDRNSYKLVRADDIEEMRTPDVDFLVSRFDLTSNPLVVDGIVNNLRAGAMSSRHKSVDLSKVTKLTHKNCGLVAAIRLGDKPEFIGLMPVESPIVVEDIRIIAFDPTYLSMVQKYIGLSSGVIPVNSSSKFDSSKPLALGNNEVFSIVMPMHMPRNN